ncbi:hypothetical protein C8R43DRAFT_953812 [Mycena crocata]|nr:hypothetical protein C8R43DRAFT_953812 [Mycena crocata]
MTPVSGNADSFEINKKPPALENIRCASGIQTVQLAPSRPEFVSFPIPQMVLYITYICLDSAKKSSITRLTRNLRCWRTSDVHRAFRLPNSPPLAPTWSVFPLSKWYCILYIRLDSAKSNSITEINQKPPVLENIRCASCIQTAQLAPRDGKNAQRRVASVPEKTNVGAILGSITKDRQRSNL